MGRGGITLCRQAAAADVDGTMAVARQWAPLLLGASLLVLEGPLGAGKTSFVKGLAAALALARAEDVTSPTFALLHEYRHGGRALYHFDLYRLRGSDDFIALGFEDYLADRQALSCVEWSDRIADLLPAAYWQVTIALQQQGRQLSLYQVGESR